jgi:hypothetical protein
MGVKSAIFSLLPEAVQHRIILRKTGFRKIESAPLTDHIRADFFLTPKSKTWDARLDKAYGHEPGVVRWFEKNLRADDVVYDIGANMGYYGVLVNHLHHGVEFHGFEANWFVNYYQRLNRDHMGLKKSWPIIEKLVGDKDQGEFIRVDTYIRSHSGPTIFLMDVDGEEVTVLRGAPELIRSGKATFLIEVHPKDLADRGKTVDEVMAFFPKEQYALRYLPALREAGSVWSETISAADRKEEFFLLATPLSNPRY